jgi:hypothetical protein
MRRNTLTDTDHSLSSASANEVDLFPDLREVPGIFERRYFLQSSLATTAAVLALGAATRSFSAQERAKEMSVSSPASSTDKLTWSDFLKQSVPIAQQLIAEPGFSLDEYLYRIGSLATRLNEIPDTKLYPYKPVAPQVSFAPSFRGSPFFIIQWRMEPNAKLPPHNHPNASVCTLGFEGEVRLRNFEIVGEAPDYASKKTFRVYETHNETISRGRINTLSPSRDNIHCFQAGSEGARGIDISTLHGNNAGFSFLDINEKPVNSEKRIFEAAWNDIGR